MPKQACMNLIWRKEKEKEMIRIYASRCTYLFSRMTPSILEILSNKILLNQFWIELAMIFSKYFPLPFVPCWEIVLNHID